MFDSLAIINGAISICIFLYKDKSYFNIEIKDDRNLYYIS